MIAVVTVAVIVVPLCSVLAESGDENTRKGVGDHRQDVASNDDANPNNDASDAPLL